MVTYKYTNIPEALNYDEDGNLLNLPDLNRIHDNIFQSNMTNKSILYCNWNEKNRELYIIFDVELNNNDKSLLDSIVLSLKEG